MSIAELPLAYDFDQSDILKKCIVAHRKLAELKGICHKIPNSDILINNITLTESKDSSEIENIITTYNELYQQTADILVSSMTKEVMRYRDALQHGYKISQKNQLLTNNHISGILINYLIRC